MKNLNVLVRTKTNFDANIIGYCIDADNKRYFALTEDFNILESQNNRLQATAINHDFDKLKYGIERLTRDDVILMEYVVEISSILIILATGHFIHIALSSFSPPSDCQYQHAKRVSSAKISPDQDLIALADEANDLLILQTNDYTNTIHATNALTENDSLYKPVGVGWGSKETQFFGLDGRPAKETESKSRPNIDETSVADDEKIFDSDSFKSFKKSKDKSTLIDWRGDGQLIATLTFIPETEKHYLKVWNRNLELQYMSEQLVTMEGGLLTWIPNGQYVCCGQRRNGGINEIVMFEKNGMVHQRVTLPLLLHNLHISNLSWSPDSNILAILGIKFEREDSGDVRKKFVLMLYTMQNFQYYLKYSVYLSCELGNLIRWDPINHSKLYVCSLTGWCEEYDCTSTVTYSRDHSTVAVVDGNKVMITPFSICNIPPPMAAIRIELGSLISRIVLGPESAKNFVVLTMENRLISVPSDAMKLTSDKENFFLDVCLKSEPIKNFKSRLECLTSFNIENGNRLQNSTIMNDGSLLVTNQVGYDCRIQRIEIDNPKSSMRPLQTIKSNQVIRIAQNFSPSNKYHLFLDNGTCEEIDCETGDIERKFALDSTTDRLHVLDAYYTESMSFAKVISLTQDHTLRANEHILSSNSCTSFRISENFLIYTTTDNNLHFVPKSKILPPTIPADIESYNQPIEMGGTLIVVSEQDSKVILQMPRGNLEVLHPRILVLLSVSRLLDQNKYLEAMKEARRHRVDLNFICDYLMHREGDNFFTDILNKFVLQIVEHDQSLLNLFINELRNEDTLLGRYSTIMRCLPLDDQNNHPISPEIIKTKVHKVCSNIDLQNLTGYDRIQPHILCLIRQEPRRVCEALEMIRNCADIKPGLDFLLYFIDIEQLFLEALATYDTKLALMVANASTKDPKEYLASLDQFNEHTDQFFRCYKIDKHLKNYEKAFQNIYLHYESSLTSNSDEVNRFMVDFVASNRIYKPALRFIEKGGMVAPLCALKTHLWTKYGDYLLEKRYHLEAGLSYWRAIRPYHDDSEILDKAMMCLLLVEDWEKCALLIKREHKQLSDQKKSDYINKITNQLVSRGKYAEAFIVKQSITDEDLAYQLFKKGDLNFAYVVVPESDEWSVEECTRLIDGQVRELLTNWKEKIDTARARFKRLKELISTYESRRTNHLGADNCYSSDSLSTIDGSDASSIISEGTAKQKVARSGAPSIKTRASSKSSKSKIDKAKKINLKEGSRHADIALILELKKFIAKQKSYHKLALQTLATYFVIRYSKICDYDEHRESLSKSLSDQLELAREITSKLWPTSDQEDQTFSLYRRFSNLFTSSQTVLENVDFEVLIRPELPEELRLLEI